MQEVNSKAVGDFAYIDESRVDHNIAPERGWGKVGVELKANRSGNAYDGTSSIAGICDKKILAPMYFEGHTDSELFLCWLEQCLLLELRPGQTVIMDNASWHNSQKVSEILARKNCTVLFLPPYSPDLNPIEHYWAWLKNKIRDILRFSTSFFDALNCAFSMDYSCAI